MLERRKGGEIGVEWLQTYRGDKFWKAQGQEMVSTQFFMPPNSERDVFGMPRG